LVFIRELPDRFEITGHSKDLGLERKVEITLIYKKCKVVMWTGFIWLRIGAYNWLPWRGKRLGVSYKKGATHKGLLNRVTDR
jgi:hypothetical protein